MILMMRADLGLFPDIINHLEPRSLLAALQAHRTHVTKRATPQNVNLLHVFKISTKLESLKKIQIYSVFLRESGPKSYVVKF